MKPSLRTILLRIREVVQTEQKPERNGGVSLFIATRRSRIHLQGWSLKGLSDLLWGPSFRPRLWVIGSCGIGEQIWEGGWIWRRNRGGHGGRGAFRRAFRRGCFFRRDRRRG